MDVPAIDKLEAAKADLEEQLSAFGDRVSTLCTLLINVVEQINQAKEIDK